MSEQSPILATPPQLASRIHAYAVLIVPFLGTIAAVASIPYLGFGAPELVVLSTLWAATSCGLAVGFHRLFSHGSFEAARWVRALLAVVGCMAAQGSALYWANNHRRHHHFSDKPGDPHSPWANDSGELRGFAGFWHAHVGWVYRHRTTNVLYYCKDLLRDRWLAWIDARYLLWVVLGLVLPAAVVGLWRGTLAGALSGLLWGGFARLFIVLQATSCINSLTHLIGSRPFATREQSRNVAWLWIFTFGESWHNNHHAFPSAALVGFHPWQIDPGSYLILGLERLGLAWNVKRPPDEAQRRRRARSTQEREQEIPAS